MKHILIAICLLFTLMLGAQTKDGEAACKEKIGQLGELYTQTNNLLKVEEPKFERLKKELSVSKTTNYYQELEDKAKTVTALKNRLDSIHTNYMSYKLFCKDIITE